MFPPCQLYLYSYYCDFKLPLLLLRQRRSGSSDRAGISCFDLTAFQIAKNEEFVVVVVAVVVVTAAAAAVAVVVVVGLGRAE